jgi:hypothetical protein
LHSHSRFIAVNAEINSQVVLVKGNTLQHPATMPKFSRESRIITLLVIDTIFFFVVSGGLTVGSRDQSLSWCA